MFRLILIPPSSSHVKSSLPGCGCAAPAVGATLGDVDDEGRRRKTAKIKQVPAAAIPAPMLLSQLGMRGIDG
jgi:hypothetical protein